MAGPDPLDHSPAIEAARNFLTVAWEGPAPTDAALSAALDRLLTAYHAAPGAAPSDSDREAPGRDYPSLYKEVAARFPDYGLYPVADPMGQPNEAVMMADAIDDLADLTSDMREVVWFVENLGTDDAYRAFRLHFPHWGRHARELSLYLHARQFG